MDHYQELEAERLASTAQQAHIHLDSVASQTLPIAHAIADLPGHGSKRIRRIPDPDYIDTPGASSSGPAPPEPKWGRSRSREPNIRARSQAPVYESRDKDFEAKPINTIIQNYRKHELKRFMQLRGIDSEKLTVFDMATKLKEHDTRTNKTDRNEQINAKFDKPGKSQRAKSLEALKSRGVKG